MGVGRRLTLVSGAVAILSGCAGPTLSARQPLDPQDWRRELLSRGFEPDELENPLSSTEEMRREARQAAGEGGSRERLARLHRHLFERGTSFDYDTFTTATAVEAFEHRAGNCVAITSLFIAMSRALGIPVVPALLRSVDDAETTGDLVLVKNHIVALLRHEGTVSVYDFYREREALLIGIRPIDDLWLAAIYRSNQGVQALREGELARAAQLFDDAIRLAPAYAAVYGNLAVVRRRQGDALGALDAYLVALQIEPENDVLRANLSELLPDLARASGNPAEAPVTDVDDLTRRADAALARGALREACKLLRRVRRREPERMEPLVTLARCQLARGRIATARERLEQAAVLSPGNAEVEQLLDRLKRVELPPPEWPAPRTEPDESRAPS